MKERKNEIIIKGEKIENLIYTIRGQQVMIDSDIAELFEVDIKYLNRQMKRNLERFPKDFCYKINSLEFKNLRCQNVTFKLSTKGRKYPPYVYSEHGILALAGVLKSDVAARMSIEIVRKFVQMRKFIAENGDLLLSLARIQNRQLEFENDTNQKFDEVFRLIENVDLPKTALICAGEWFDAYEYITSIINKAKTSIFLIDPYCDDKALMYLAHHQENISITVVNGPQSKLKPEEIELFRTQYGPIELKTFDDIHDRYLIIDNEICFSLGTSLNSAGKKLFTINKIEDKHTIDFIISKINS